MAMAHTGELKIAVYVDLDMLHILGVIALFSSNF
jgi:hypothetical protein